MIGPSASLRFTVLGPIRAWTGDEELGLGTPQQRAVLAALLLRRRHPLTVGELVDAVWGEDPPSGAVSVLRTYVSRLRKVLEPERETGADPQVMVSVADGYALRLPQDALDLDVFERRVGEAKRLRAAGDVHRAADLLHEALGAWGGAPLAGVPGPLADIERMRLSDYRLATLESRIEMDLELGCHAEIVPELRALIREHPLREEIGRLLMLALYRCGRQAEALAAYRAIRGTLVAELGVGPGPVLRELQHRILNDDPALTDPSPADPGPTDPAPTDPAPADPVPVDLGPADPAPQPSSAAHTQPPQTAPEQSAQSRPSPTEPAPAPRPALIAPAQLPADPPTFTGRAAELERLQSLLAEDGTGPAVVVISGMAGSGKSALATHWAHRIAPRFPDGVLHVDLRGFDPTGTAIAADDAVRGFLDALGVDPRQLPAGPDARAALYRSLLAGRRMLVVLDNARDTDQVRPLLPGAPGCLAVVTSRDQLTTLVAVDGARTIDLDLLPLSDARGYLARRLGMTRLAAEPRAASEIVTLCGRLPLPLATVAARAATHPDFPLSALVAELREGHGSLDAFAGADPATDTRTAFSGSYRLLAPATARLFRLLALHPGPDIDASAAAALAGAPLRETRPLLAALTRAHLLTEHQPGRYVLHDLLRVHAAELTQDHDTPAERDAAMRRTLDHYLDAACTAAARLSPDSPALLTAPDAAGPRDSADCEQALAWFAAEQPVLLVAVEQAATTGFEGHSWQLAWALMPFLQHAGRRSEQVAVQTIALAAAQRAGDRTGQAHCRRNLARAHVQAERYDNALAQAQHALDTFVELGDRSGQALAHGDLAEVLLRQDKLHQALRHQRHALHLHRAVGDRPGQAHACTRTGWILALRGEHSRALSYCRQALALSEEVGDRVTQAAVWDTLGHIHHRRGDHREAASAYERACDLNPGPGQGTSDPGPTVMAP
ncbi:AfsR/SARP family transcriptional regulator [Streptomyces sp. NPDC050523]|uniref:AfsR/SARP family transcriptional regulator n=1 Tax=Streptomyces sp. NPDC050523 TaxID=3365622 RepID=UPI003799C341